MNTKSCISIFLYLLPCFITTTCVAQKNRDKKATEEFVSLKAENVCIRGNIKDFSPTTTNTSGLISYINTITREGSSVVVPIDSQGNFNVSLQLSYPVRNHLIIRETYIPFYIKPGETLEIFIDWNKLKNKDLANDAVRYKGKSGKMNAELYYTRNLIYVNSTRTTEAELTIPRTVYSTQKSNELKKIQDTIAKLAKQKLISPNTANILRQEALFSNAENLIYYDQLTNMQLGQEKSSLTELPVKDPFYNFLQQLPGQDKSILSTLALDYFMEAFEYAALFYNTWQLKYNTPQSSLALIENAGFKLTPEEEKLKSVPNDSLVQIFKEKYNYIYGLLEQIQVKGEVYKELQLNHSLIFDIGKVRLFQKCLNDVNADKASILFRYATADLQYPFLKQEAQRLLDKKLNENLSKKYRLPEGTATDIFRKIVDPHKGKIVLVDFWSPYCSPCVQGIESMQPLREKYKEIAFVFITSEGSSPAKEDYDKIMDPVKGYKHRLDDNEHNYLYALFKFNMIPHYVLLDREGFIINDNYHPDDHTDSYFKELLQSPQ